MHATSYQNNIYPFQNELLALVQGANVDFYLTGGTALSRFYLNHRYSDDLDFFVNQNSEYHNPNNICSQFMSEDNKV